ncbi:alpha/beta fold hydrolase [Psychroflexus planctonicus]|uniref:Alpha/beta hydrolase n=1 Tax=Psychroflexus planctonicus TaxID=1526575 RepID=A0ABQ1SI08_9FLAO|nr:alpha/beta hydrolase [Psychroflexus planctonicus]GGE39631.1 alpha/beta hydrolase [Psychroflexus planctonicus]
MENEIQQQGKFKFIERGEGTPMLILHGLMGGLSNFDGVADYFPQHGYKVVIPELPIYDMPLLKTNIKNITKFIKEFIEAREYEKVILLGNSLGGHIGLLTTKLYPEYIKGLVITGSSGLYESAMGDSYPKKGDYEYIKKKAQDVFYDPAVATEEIIEDVYQTIKDRNKLIRILSIAKSAIRHNMAKDLPNMKQPTCIIWGKQDDVTPPKVADEFNKLLPNSELFWIDKCGHAAMMEHPDLFNEILHEWLRKNAL